MKFPKFRILTLASIMMVVFLGVMINTLFSGMSSTPTALPEGVINELLQKSANVSSLEDKVQFLFELSRKQLEASRTSKPTFNIQNYMNPQTLFVVVPLLIIVGCAIYTVANCYPRAVFLWGDYEEHYEQLASRRNTLWTVVVLSIALGILGNLFVMGLSNFVKIGQ